MTCSTDEQAGSATYVLHRRGTLAGGALAVMAWLTAAASAADNEGVRLVVQPDRVRIELDGQFFSDYLFFSGSKPCLYPILDADGTPFTRDWPLREDTDEPRDHEWHRSVWFGLGLVNGHDFWRRIPEKGTGEVRHQQVLETRDGPDGLLRVAHQWVDAQGQVVCTDETALRFRRVAAGTIVDHRILLQASHGPLVVGDTEEGAMGVRVREALRVVHPDRRGTGTILNARGDRNEEAWGKRAPWCDYYGPLPDGRTIGIAIFDHPRNHAHPTWWHARPYGLFAANPFGKHDFEGLSDQPRAGELAIPAGGTLDLRHALYFHHGDTAAAGVAEQYRQFALLP